VGVHHLTADMVRERWTNPFWRLFNVGLISFALLHGLNGARYSIEDYVRGPGLQTAVKTVVYLIGIAALVVGVYALLTFNPQVHA
jgi:succinate dehydrogenase / fumarate reductase, membrane anchor subunit